MSSIHKEAEQRIAISSSNGHGENGAASEEAIPSGLILYQEPYLEVESLDLLGDEEAPDTSQAAYPLARISPDGEVVWPEFRRERIDSDQPDIEIGPETFEAIEHHVTQYQRYLADVNSKLKQVEKVEWLPGQEVNDELLEDYYRDPSLFVRSHLTPAGQTVLYLEALGLGNIEIAEIMGISHNMVKNCMRGILKRFHLTSREGARSQAIRQGAVEPLLLPLHYNFSGLRRLTDKRREVYDLVSDPDTARSNREITKATFISEQTIKNHLTAVLTELGLEDRGELRMLEVKRRDHIAMTEGEDVKNAVRQKKAQGQITKDDYLDILSATNDLEVAAQGIFWGLYTKGQIASSESYARVQELTPDQRSFLRRVGAFSDLIGIRDRWKHMYTTQEVYNTQFAQIRDVLQVPNYTAAVIVGMVEDRQDFVRDLKVRTQRLDWLEERYGENK